MDNVYRFDDEDITDDMMKGNKIYVLDEVFIVSRFDLKTKEYVCFLARSEDAKKEDTAS